MITFPNAKINLGLQVVAKRPDGYHNIESVFYPIGLKDALEVIVLPHLPNGEVKFESTGLEIPGNPDNNLCVKAYRLLDAEFGLPALSIHLHKTIPMGAGLGGGSADGAFCIALINAVCDLKLSEEKMEEFALELGSDCPFFIKNTPMYVTGRGEHLEPIQVNLDGYYLLVVNPKVHVGTAEAYSGIVAQPSKEKMQNILEHVPEKWQGRLVNDFEKSVFPNHPAIATLKMQMEAQGAAYCSMTGSGSTVYGLFKTLPSTDLFRKQGYTIWLEQLAR